MALPEQYADIAHRITNHPPANAEVVRRLEAVANAAIAFGRVVVAMTPESREQSLALTNLEQTTMWARAAIARNQERILPDALFHIPEAD